MKSHIHEAKLVQLLEEKGIGRPSTFSTIVEKIQHREYVKKENIEGSKIQCTDYDLEDDEITESHSTKVFGNEKGKLVIQPLGILVMEFLNAHFQDLFNYDYTREMEEGLDKVAKGERKWTDICEECLTQIDSLCETVKEEPTGIKIDENHQYIIGKHGPIIKQTTASSKKRDDTAFIPVRKDIDLEKLKNGEYTLEDIVDNQVGAQKSKLMGKYKDEDLFIKKGKFGIYALWGKQTTSLSSFGNRPMENITLEEVLHVLENPTASNFENVNATRENYDISQKIVRTLSPHLSVRSGRFGDYIYYKTAEMKKPTFLKLKGFTGGDYKTCSSNVLQEWIMSTHFSKKPNL
jgi:DNA topoisomerase-1